MVQYCKQNWHICHYNVYDLQSSQSELHKNSDRAVGLPGIPPGKPRKVHKTQVTGTTEEK